MLREPNLIDTRHARRPALSLLLSGLGAALFLFPRLAQAQVPQTTAPSLGGWLINLAAILVILVAALKAWSYLFPRRQPPLEAEFATKQEVHTLRVEITSQLAEQKTALSELRDHFDEQYESLQRSDESRSSHLHNRLNDISDRVSGVGREMENVAKQVRILLNKALRNGGGDD